MRPIAILSFALVLSAACTDERTRAGDSGEEGEGEGEGQPPAEGEGEGEGEGEPPAEGEGEGPGEGEGEGQPPAEGAGVGVGDGDGEGEGQPPAEGEGEGEGEGPCPDSDEDDICDGDDPVCDLDRHVVMCAMAPPPCAVAGEVPTMLLGCPTGECMTWAECAAWQPGPGRCAGLAREACEARPECAPACISDCDCTCPGPAAGFEGCGCPECAADCFAFWGCVAITGCRDDDDCAPHEVCRRGLDCRPGCPEEATHCCYGNECAVPCPEDVECPCPDGTAGICLADGVCFCPDCETDDDCPLPERCRGGECVPCEDPDEDAVCSDEDNCPWVPSMEVVDDDGDGVGNACDPDTERQPGEVCTVDVRHCAAGSWCEITRCHEVWEPTGPCWGRCVEGVDPCAAMDCAEDCVSGRCVPHDWGG